MDHAAFETGTILRPTVHYEGGDAGFGWNARREYPWGLALLRLGSGGNLVSTPLTSSGLRVLENWTGYGLLAFTIVFSSVGTLSNHHLPHFGAGVHHN